jgi:hypothetical protein
MSPSPGGRRWGCGSDRRSSAWRSSAIRRSPGDGSLTPNATPAAAAASRARSNACRPDESMNVRPRASTIIDGGCVARASLTLAQNPRRASHIGFADYGDDGDAVVLDLDVQVVAYGGFHVIRQQPSRPVAPSGCSGQPSHTGLLRQSHLGLRVGTMPSTQVKSPLAPTPSLLSAASSCRRIAPGRPFQRRTQTAPGGRTRPAPATLVRLRGWRRWSC